MKSVVVVGAGASGYTAAIKAAKQGAQVLLLDRQSKTARKVLASGNGRCNLGNRRIDITCYQTQTPPILQGFLRQNDKVDKFWDEAGLLTRADEDGRLYPWSNRAQSVAYTLALQAKAAGVKCIQRDVKSIEKRDKWVVHTAEEDIVSDCVVIATGSISAPSLGATDTGLDIAKSLGIAVTPLRPSLVPLCTSPHIASIKGCRQSATLSYMRGNVQCTEHGEVLFTEYGLSGIAVMQLSAFVGVGDFISMDLTPQLPLRALKQKLAERVSSGIYPTIDCLLVGILEKPLSYALLKEAGLSPLDMPVAQVTQSQIDNLAAVLKGWRFEVTGTQGYDAAQVAIGGVRLDQLDENLQSVRHKGLYFCGEVVDVAGLCGGYNLHWAWLSGIIVGEHAGVRTQKS